MSEIFLIYKKSLGCSTIWCPCFSSELYFKRSLVFVDRCSLTHFIRPLGSSPVFFFSRTEISSNVVKFNSFFLALEVMGHILLFITLLYINFFVFKRVFYSTKAHIVLLHLFFSRQYFFRFFPTHYLSIKYAR